MVQPLAEFATALSCITGCYEKSCNIILFECIDFVDLGYD